MTKREKFEAYGGKIEVLDGVEVWHVAVRLIDCGWANAVQARGIRVGMIMLFNYGYTGTVLATDCQGAGSIKITIQNDDGQYTSTKRHGTLIPVRTAPDGTPVILPRAEAVA